MGPGRRPGSRDVERLSRRQGLADGSYAQAVARLEELAGRNGHGSRVPTPAELLAGLREDGRRGD